MLDPAFLILVLKQMMVVLPGGPSTFLLMKLQTVILIMLSLHDLRSLFIGLLGFLELLFEEFHGALVYSWQSCIV